MKKHLYVFSMVFLLGILFLSGCVTTTPETVIETVPASFVCRGEGGENNEDKTVDLICRAKSFEIGDGPRLDVIVTLPKELRQQETFTDLSVVFVPLESIPFDKEAALENARIEIKYLVTNFEIQDQGKTISEFPSPVKLEFKYGPEICEAVGSDQPQFAFWNMKAEKGEWVKFTEDKFDIEYEPCGDDGGSIQIFIEFWGDPPIGIVS